MLKLRESSVVGTNKKYLDDQQSLIDQQPDYAAQVEKAKYLWEHKSTAIFAEQRRLLESLCSGARRCHYCEDSAADERDGRLFAHLAKSCAIITRIYLCPLGMQYPG